MTRRCFLVCLLGLLLSGSKSAKTAGYVALARYDYERLSRLSYGEMKRL